MVGVDVEAAQRKHEFVLKQLATEREIEALKVEKKNRVDDAGVNTDAGKALASNFDAEIAAKQSLLTIDAQRFKLQEEINASQERQNKLLEASTSIADSLKAVFEGMSEAVTKQVEGMGSFVEALAKVAI